MTAWAAVYRLAGESEPAIWLVPCLFTVAGTGAMVAVVRGLEGGNAA